MGDTKISWTHRPGTIGKTWNPVQGCSRISEGCRACYAERMAARFAEDGWSQGLINLKTRKWNGVVRLAPHKLADPLRWRQPCTVFTNSMSDLFHEGLSNEQIAAVFGVMAAAPQHTFQVLTKRARRMREWFETPGIPQLVETFRQVALAGRIAEAFAPEQARNILTGKQWTPEHEPAWPLPSVWLGVSVENQEAADTRIPELLASPAAVRFLSCEPLIGPVRLDDIGKGWSALARTFAASMTPRGERVGIDWAIAGCESGPGARPCSVEWLRSLRDQCAAAGVAYFLKQARESSETSKDPHDGVVRQSVRHGLLSHRKAGGVIELPYLDGVQHAAFPEADPEIRAAIAHPTPDGET